MTKEEKEEYSRAFGSYLRKLRIESGFGKREFANEADMEYSLLGKIEAGKSNPTLFTIIRLASALKVHPSALLGFITKNTSNKL